MKDLLGKIIEMDGDDGEGSGWVEGRAKELVFERFADMLWGLKMRWEGGEGIPFDDLVDQVTERVGNLIQDFDREAFRKAATTGEGL